MRKIFTIIGNQATAFDSLSAAQQYGEGVKPGELKILAASEQQLASSGLTGKQLIELWNSLPGAAPVKKFTDRKVAVARIWRELQKLPAMHDRQDSAQSAATTGPREGTKKGRVLEMLRQPQGASLKEIMEATGCLKSKPATEFRMEAQQPNASERRARRLLVQARQRGIQVRAEFLRLEGRVWINLQVEKSRFIGLNSSEAILALEAMLAASEGNGNAKSDNTEAT